MRIMIQNQLDEKLTLPLNYHQILQGIIYHNLDNSHGYSEHLHNEGYFIEERRFRMFTFSCLQGTYKVLNKQITFENEISFQVSSPDVWMLQQLMYNLLQNGIAYTSRKLDHVNIYISDATVESDEVMISMLSPICVYTTDPITRKTVFYEPGQQEFQQGINQNFRRKYEAYYGVDPESEIEIIPINVTSKDKYVTRYKNFIINAWKGTYCLKGKRKYLDFLLQTGLGSKNSQGFGMFEEILPFK